MPDQHPHERGPIRTALLNSLTGGADNDRIGRRWSSILGELLDGAPLPLDDYRRFIRSEHDPWVARQSDTALQLSSGLADSLRYDPTGARSAIGSERFQAALPMMLTDAAATLRAAAFPLLQRHQRLAWDAVLHPDTYEPHDLERAGWIAGLGRAGNAADAIHLVELRDAVRPLVEQEIEGAAELAAATADVLTMLDTTVPLWEIFARHGHERLAALPAPPPLRHDAGSVSCDWIVADPARDLFRRIRIVPDTATHERERSEDTILLNPHEDLTAGSRGGYEPGTIAARFVATNGRHPGTVGSISPQGWARLQHRARASLGGGKVTPPTAVIRHVYQKLHDEAIA